MFNSTVVGNGLDAPTPVFSEEFVPVPVKVGAMQSFYVALQGPYLRYSTWNTGDRRFYINQDVTLYAQGAAKRKGFSGGIIEPRVFNGGVKYLLGSEPLEVSPQNIAGLPTVAPTVSMVPSLTPTNYPTARPTSKPTAYPTASPIIRTGSFTTAFDNSDTTYAGTMFDILAKYDMEIKGLGFNTFRTDDVNVQVYTKSGSFEGSDQNIQDWTLVVNTTVVGQGIGVPTMIPEDSFERVTVLRSQRQAFYVTSDGPYMRATKGVQRGLEVDANDGILLYTGAGKRLNPAGMTTFNRVWNGVVVYETIDSNPSPSKLDGVETETASYIFPAEASTYVQDGVNSTLGSKAQLLVDGLPKRVTLIKFDLSSLTLDDIEVKKAKLSLYAMTNSEFGGKFSVFPEGSLDQTLTTWDTTPYSNIEGVDAGGLKGPINEKEYYEKDLTAHFVNGIPSVIVVRIASDRPNGVMYRSQNGAPNKGPQLDITFATEPNSEVMKELFGTEAPTPAPTVEKQWPNPLTMSDPPGDYFNYNPRSSYGPNRWDTIRQDEWYEQYRGLDANLWRNYCIDGRRQSPRDLCQTDDECQEFHQPRPRVREVKKSCVCLFVHYIRANNFAISSYDLNRRVNTILMTSLPPSPSQLPTSCTTSSASHTKNEGASGIVLNHQVSTLLTMSSTLESKI